MNPFSRAWTLAGEFIGLGALSLLVIVWAVRRRRGVFERISTADVWLGFRREVGRIVLHGDPAPYILAVSLLVISIGVKFVLPMDTLGSAQSYAYLNRTVFNETTWGLGLVGLGVSKLVLLGYNAIPSPHPYRLSYFLGAALNAFMALIWVNFALGFVFSNSHTFGHLTYSMLAGLNVWAAARRLRQGVGGS